MQIQSFIKWIFKQTFQCDLAEPCYPGARCVNLRPGYRCGPCPPGYTGSPGVEGAGIEEAHRNKQRCYDINECNDGRNGGCASNSQCVNTEVSQNSDNQPVKFAIIQTVWNLKYIHKQLLSINILEC